MFRKKYQEFRKKSEILREKIFGEKTNGNPKY